MRDDEVMPAPAGLSDVSLRLSSKLGACHPWRILMNGYERCDDVIDSMRPPP